MIEIVVMGSLFFKLRGMLIEKGRGQALAFLGPLFWLVGEFIGAIITAVILALIQVDDKLILYGGALLGAALGAFTAYMIIHSIAARSITCPFCQSTLPAETSRMAARITCRTCGRSLVVLDSKVSEVT